MKKVLLFTAILAIVFFQESFSQKKFYYGIQSGISYSGKYKYQEYTNSIIQSTLHKKLDAGDINPTVGMSVHFFHHHLYLSTGVDYNRVRSSSYSYDESLLYYNSPNPIKYYYEDYKQFTVSKINMPMVVGVSIANKKKIKPLLFAGVNAAYLSGLHIFYKTNNENPVTKQVTTIQKNIYPFSKHTNYIAPGRVLSQFIGGVGFRYGEHAMLKASMRLSKNLFIVEKSNGDFFQCILVGYTVPTQDVGITFTYLF